MKRKWLSVMTFILILFGFTIQAHASGEWTEIPTNPDDTLKKIPENTKCREIEFGEDEKRIDTNGGKTFYDLCIGSFPKFPSTQIEEGTAPYYYLKYYFFPDPMPIYDVSNPSVTIGDNTIVGLKQEVNMTSQDIEAYDYPLDDTNKDLFVHYPYDASHADVEPYSSIRGPYQVGYNSFYHNTYRGRFFAEEVTFEFYVLEPHKQSMTTIPVGDDNETYAEKTILFAGEIIYDLYDPSDPHRCFEKEYLDYTDECRSIEFYFPTSRNGAAEDVGGIAGIDSDRVYQDIEVIQDIGGGPSNKNTIWEHRLPYKNPGEHKLVVKVRENTQLRLQKDIGGEFQRIPGGASGSEQGAGEFDRAQQGEVYFLRQDEDTGTGITYRNERGINFPDAPLTTVGNPILKLVDGHWVYDPTANESYFNYCDVDTNTFGGENYDFREDVPIGTLEEALQNNTTCYHNKNAEYHYWKYYWSNTFWYADNPEEYLDR